MGVTVGLGTIAIIYVLWCVTVRPPETRTGLILFACAAASLGVFGTLATGIATGIAAFDGIINQVPALGAP